MNPFRISRLHVRTWALAVLVPLVLAGAARAHDQAPATSGPRAGEGVRVEARGLYSVINLAAEGSAGGFLNERGQVAYTSYVFPTNGYFDGDRLYELGSLGGGFTSILGLNNRGVVVGHSTDNNGPFGDLRAFAWTRARGMRALPGIGATAHAVNDRNQVAGLVPAPGISGRAVRWDPDGRVAFLGPLPVSLSEARAINDDALAGGFYDLPDGSIHATVWDGAGRLTDLGTLGGALAFTFFVNRAGEAAGVGDLADGRQGGFYWSARSGLVRIGLTGPGVRLVADLNGRGEIVGNSDGAAGAEAFLWSRTRGLRRLPGAGASATDVFDIGERGVMVGRTERPGAGWRAVRWDGMAAPVDLNTRLYRPPAGLLLSAATALNEAGDILASSNAGLVLLRPGKRGTDAPVLGPITGLPEEATVGQEVEFRLSFVDNAPGQSHSASAAWSSGCPGPHPLVREARGVGEVRMRHRFCAAGFTDLTVRVSDSGGRATEVRRQVFVNAPGMAAVSGRGALAALPSGAGRRPSRLHFTFWAPLAGPQALGATAPASHIHLAGPFHSRAEQLHTAAREGPHVRLEGVGRYDGRPGYRFLIEASDGAGAGGGDRVRVRISHTDGAGGEVVDYDNGHQPAGRSSTDGGAPDRSVVEEGSVTVHG